MSNREPQKGFDTEQLRGGGEACAEKASPAGVDSTPTGRILKRGMPTLAADAELPTGRLVRATAASPVDHGEVHPGVVGAERTHGACAGVLPKHAHRAAILVKKGGSGFLALCGVTIAMAAFVPSTLESATAFVVTKHERLISTITSLATEYRNVPAEKVRVPEIEPPAVTARAAHSGVVATPLEGASFGGNARTPRGGERPISPAALLHKVHRIIKEHAPRHRTSRALAEAIVAESAEQRFDPLFVAAVIKSESTFNALARSHVGAQGLMQIMPKTGAWLAAQEEMPRGRLTDPGYNLKLGIRYLKYLDGLYSGDRMFSLIAYNWGPGRVESATDGKRRVPPEVTTYALKILKDYRKWRAEIYTGG